ncbi:MAG: hypothetical protein H0X25_01340 [Acidobacteriales bacterium]|nr:hypothetical protein [Terriglobales bacterium]
MSVLLLSIAIQISLMAGVAGLLWPEKFMPVFEILLFPWAATQRMLRANSLASIGVALLLFFTLVVR